MGTLRRQMASLGLEAVDFQYDKLFFKELTLAVGKLRNISRRNKTEVERLNLGRIIEDHTGIAATVGVDSASYLNAWVYPPTLDINHALLNNYWRGDYANTDSLSAIRRAKGVIKGSVNRTTGKVTGVFTQFTPSIFVTEGLFGAMTDEEIAAIILHEVGHCMSFFELLGAQLTTNMALKAACDAFTGTTTQEQRYAILTAVEETLDVKITDKDALKNARPEVLTTVVLKQVIETSRSATGTPLYDLSGWEFMSDQYASRMGAGRALTTAMDKIYRSQGVLFIEALRSPAMHLFLEALSIIKTVVISAVSGAMFGGIVGAILFTLLSTGFKTAVSGIISGERDYDTPEARLKRIRNQLVESLKVKDLPAERRKMILHDIAVVDDVIKSYHDRQDFFDYLYSLMSASRRQQENQIVIQQELEKLISNDLYVKANQLKDLPRS